MGGAGQPTGPRRFVVGLSRVCLPVFSACWPLQEQVERRSRQQGHAQVIGAGR